MSRRNKFADVDPFSHDDEKSGELSFAEVDESLFGKQLSQLDAGRQVVKPIRIHDIYPDPSQPRRAMPSAVRKYWSGIDSISQLLLHWAELVSEERGSGFELGAYLLADGEVERTEEPGPMEAAFLQLVELAASIRRDGLTNPITVVRAGRQYRIETGERRWLAYHLLFLFFDGSAHPDERELWEKIPARQVEEVDVWRQASENTARENLNAISRARQFAVLLMNLLEERGEVFQPYHRMVTSPDACDRVYYAQVGDKNPPYGTGDQLLNAMGLSHRAAFTRCRHLLSLPDEVWTIGDDLSLAEDTLLTLAKLPPDEAIARAREAANVASRNISDNPNITRDRPTLSSKTPPSPGSKPYFSQIHRILNRVGEGKTENNQRAWDILQEHKRWIEEMEQRILRYLE